MKTRRMLSQEHLTMLSRLCLYVGSFLTGGSE